MSIDELLKFVYGLAEDHKPDGWPAIQMQEITPLADEIVRLRAENKQLKNSIEIALPTIGEAKKRAKLKGHSEKSVCITVSSLYNLKCQFGNK